MVLICVFPSSFFPSSLSSASTCLLLLSSHQEKGKNPEKNQEEPSSTSCTVSSPTLFCAVKWQPLLHCLQMQILCKHNSEDDFRHVLLMTLCLLSPTGFSTAYSFCPKCYLTLHHSKDANHLRFEMMWRPKRAKFTSVSVDGFHLHLLGSHLDWLRACVHMFHLLESESVCCGILFLLHVWMLYIHMAGLFGRLLHLPKCAVTESTLTTHRSYAVAFTEKKKNREE